MVLGIRIPGFIRIHFRYLKHNPIVWLVLVLAPFIIGLMILSMASNQILETPLKNWQSVLIILFLIALAFFWAERSRKFRRIYVTAIPAMVVVNGLFSMVLKSGFGFGSLVVFTLLSVLPAWILGKLALGRGYQALSDGGFKNYRLGRNLYMEGHAADALKYLEPAARKGHMKSLYLLGHAHEHGNGYEIDLLKAARLYEKASSKGFQKATIAYLALLETFTTEQMEKYETDISTLEVNQLF